MRQQARSRPTALNWARWQGRLADRLAAGAGQSRAQRCRADPRRATLSLSRAGSVGLPRDLPRLDAGALGSRGTREHGCLALLTPSPARFTRGLRQAQSHACHTTGVGKPGGRFQSGPRNGAGADHREGFCVRIKESTSIRASLITTIRRVGSTPFESHDFLAPEHRLDHVQSLVPVQQFGVSRERPQTTVHNSLQPICHRPRRLH